MADSEAQRAALEAAVKAMSEQIKTLKMSKACLPPPHRAPAVSRLRPLRLRASTSAFP